MINWELSETDLALLDKIIERAIAEGLVERGRESTNMMMDLNAAHSNGTPMHFDKLLTAERFEFAHDLGGIRRHINRETGALEGCFLPRYALTEREMRARVLGVG